MVKWRAAFCCYPPFLSLPKGWVYCLQGCFRFPVSHCTSRTGVFWLVLKCLDYFFPVYLGFWEGFGLVCFLWGEGVWVLWLVFFLVCFLDCRFWVFCFCWVLRGFVCFILLQLFVCWCAFRRSVLLNLGCKMSWKHSSSIYLLPKSNLKLEIIYLLSGNGWNSFQIVLIKGARGITHHSLSFLAY